MVAFDHILQHTKESRSVRCLPHRNDVFQPDILIVLNERRHILTEAGAEGAPCLSKSSGPERRDRYHKIIQSYLGAAVSNKGVLRQCHRCTLHTWSALAT